MSKRDKRFMFLFFLIAIIELLFILFDSNLVQKCIDGFGLGASAGCALHIVLKIRNRSSGWEYNGVSVSSEDLKSQLDDVDWTRLNYLGYVACVAFDLGYKIPHFIIEDGDPVKFIYKLHWKHQFSDKSWIERRIRKAILDELRDSDLQYDLHFTVEIQ